MNEPAVAAISSIALILSAIAAYAVIPKQQPLQYSLTFNNDSTFDTASVPFLIDNNQGGSSKYIKIYGLENKRIFATFLSDNTQKVSADIKFNGYQKLNITKITETPKVINASVDIEQGGIFRGRMLIETADNSHSIPITVSTAPLATNAILLVVVGVLLAITLWELINYFSQYFLR